MKSVDELIDYCEKLIGTKFDNANDSSIIISSFTGIDRTPKEYYNKHNLSPTLVHSLFSHNIGWAVWTGDVIGIYVGNGRVIAALPDNDFEVKVESLSDRNWNMAFDICDIDYRHSKFQ